MDNDDGLEIPTDSAGYVELGRQASSDENFWDGLNQVWHTVRVLQGVCHQTSIEKGWWEKYDRFAAKSPTLAKQFLPEIIASKLMLSVSEHSEALEEVREEDRADLYFTVRTLGRTRRFITRSEALRWLSDHDLEDQDPKPDGFAVELADIVIRIIELAARLGLDLGEAMRLKMWHNRNREMRHGGKTI